MSMNTGKHADPPLPATVLFVSMLGIFMLIGWIAMFLLLKGRW